MNKSSALSQQRSANRTPRSGFGRRFCLWVVSLKRLFTVVFWAGIGRLMLAALVAALAAAWETVVYSAKMSAFQHIAVWMAVVCLVTFTGGPLMAQTWDAHRKRMEREERILKNLGLDEAALARNRAARAATQTPSGSMPAISDYRPAPPHAWDRHKPIEVGEVGRLTGTLRTVEENIERKLSALSRQPSAAQELEYMYKQRDTVVHMLDEMGVDVQKMKANGPKKPRYIPPLKPAYKDVKPSLRSLQPSAISHQPSAFGNRQVGSRVSKSAESRSSVTGPRSALKSQIAQSQIPNRNPAPVLRTPYPVSRIPVSVPRTSYNVDLTPDLAETPETRLGPWVDEAMAKIAKAKAERQDSSPVNAVDIYNFVHDKFEVELYFGSKKGAEATFYDGMGNDTDLSSLLIALLHANNIPARYGYNAVELNPARPKALRTPRASRRRGWRSWGRGFRWARVFRPV